MIKNESSIKIRYGPSGIHLFNRVNGLNVLLDEVKVPPALWATAPRQVSIALTNACDLDCSYCFAQKYAATLDFKRVINWLDELDANGCLGIGFGGGEPTLYKRLSELCQHATQATKLAVTLTTHAHRLEDKLLTSLVGSVNFVRVSMDGMYTTYETLRGRSFKTFCERLESIQSKFCFGINYVVNSKTFPDLDLAIKFASDFGASEFLLLPEQPVNGYGGIDYQTSKSLQDWVNHYKENVPLTVSEAGADGLPICNPLPKEMNLLGYAHIDASGNLKRTSFDTVGIPIDKNGVIQAVKHLKTIFEE